MGGMMTEILCMGMLTTKIEKPSCKDGFSILMVIPGGFERPLPA